MPTRTDDELREMNFTRDPSLSGDIADAFGGGGGDATALIQANVLRYPDELTIANDLAVNEEVEKAAIEDAGSRAKWYEAVADAADLEAINAATVRGSYIVYSFTGPDGRVGKDVLLLDSDGAMEMPKREDTPERAALRAQVQSTRAIRSAKAEAEDIVREAREKAAKIVADAAAEAESKRQEDAEAAGRAHAERAQDGGGSSGSSSGSGSSGGEDLSKLEMPELAQRAKDRGIEVQGTGKGGAVKKSDYVAALSK